MEINWTESQEQALNFRGIEDCGLITCSVWRGGSRSGKTFTAAALGLKQALWFPGTNVLFTAQTIPQIARTLEEALKKVCKIVGINLTKKRDREGGGDRYEFQNGSKIFLYPYEGAGADRIIGGEFSLIIADEFYRANIEKLSMFLTRLSGRGVNMVVMLTNPQSSMNFIHKLVEPMDNCLTYNFKVQENLGNLQNPFYLQTLEKLPPHMRKRYLDGEPADAMGQVYSMFDPGKNIIFKMPAGVAVKATVGGIDFGGTNPTAYWLLLIMSNGQIIVYSGFEQNALLRMHAARIKQINQRYPRTAIFADHDSQDRLELESYGVFTEPAPKSDKLFNIGLMQDLIESGQLVFLDPDTDSAMLSVCGYTWDEKKEDTPIKKDDHSHDAIAYAVAGAYNWGLFSKWSVSELVLGRRA